MKKTLICAVVAMVFAVSGNFTGEAQAGLIVFTDGTLWETQVGNFVTEDFNNEPLRTLALGSNTFAGFSIDTVLNGANTENANQIAAGTDSRNIDSTTFALLDFDLADAVSVSSLIFDNEITAFGADWTSTTNAGLLTMTITINGDTLLFIDYLGTPGDGFLGFVSDVPFTRLDFGLSGSSNNEYFGMDNVVYIPEPATVCLVGLGAWLLRRRKRA